MNDTYKQQVKLMLDVLPEVAKEECFALHGGTAINLFCRETPRLSVDIDLTYVEISERHEALEEINQALLRIKKRIEKLRGSIRVEHREEVCKLLISEQGNQIKIEANMVGRGVIGKLVNLPLCATAQEKFDAFCEIAMVPVGQLYGGKITAALDRQHPRDLFDVKLLLDDEGFSPEIKRGFIYSLISSNRPANELIAPNLIDQRLAFENQFLGMSYLEFSYKDFEKTRLDLIQVIRESLGDEDRSFLIDFYGLKPDWSIYDFKAYPSVKWKIINLQKFSENSPDVYSQQLDDLRDKLGN